MALEAMLSGLDLEIFTARSGDAALRLLLERDFAVILLDVQLPGMDGIETARLIRARDRNRHVPIIFLTAYSQSEDNVGRAYSVGAVDFLFKPPMREVLRSKVSVFVELERKTTEVEAQAALLRSAERREHERHLAELRATIETGVLRREMEAERRANERLQLLADVATELLGSNDPRLVVESLADRFVRHLGFEICVAYLRTNESRRLVLAGGSQLGNRPIAPKSELPDDDPLVHRVVVERRRVFAERPDPDAIPSWLADLGAQTYVAFPLTVQDRVFGILACACTERRAIGHDDLAAMQVVCDQIAMALEQQRLLTALREQTEELADAHRRKDEFLAMLAHELRNPLAPIAYSTQLMRDLVPADGDLDRLRSVIVRQLAHLTRLVDDLLDVSRITNGKIDLQLATVSVNAVLEQAIQTSRPIIENRRHACELIGLGKDVRLYADFTRLTQVVANLLNNAARYTDPGGNIRLSAEVRDGRLLISVTDDGRGIPAEMLPRIFDVFVQVERSQGLGLGLTLVRKLVQLHGGTVTATSPGSGRGSEFTIDLPIRLASVVETPESIPKPAVGSLHVLVVEDNDDSREMLQQLLEAHGHTVDVASTGTTGLDRLLDGTPDVALVDVGLPGLDGYELARAARTRNPRLSTRLVALTGYGQAEDRARALEAGFNEHIVKPVTASDLQRALQPLTSNVEMTP